ncbi:MAG: hypothetical protein IT384_27880 [Deltaproteobacteria bacterium]|nr:hypothetical protein [Deltaproteobacteria bacterium]
MVRGWIGLGLALLLGGCSQRDLFVAEPMDARFLTDIFIARGADDEWQILIQDSGQGVRFVQPREVYWLRTPAPRAEVEAWRSGGGRERCQLLRAEVRRLRLEEPMSFFDAELPEPLADLLLPGVDTTCVTCKPLDVRPIIYPLPAHGEDVVLSGGPSAVLPSGAYLALGQFEDGWFRVDMVGATSLGPAPGDLKALESLGGGRFLGAEPAQLRVLLVDAAESTVTASTAFPAPQVPGSWLLNMIVSAPGEPFEVIALDSVGRLLRFDGRAWSVLNQPSFPAVPGAIGSLVRAEPERIFFAADTPHLFEWREGRLTAHDLGVGYVSVVGSVPGFGPLAGTQRGEVLQFDGGSWRSLGLTGLVGGVRSFAPHRDGFIVLVKGGLIAQYAGYLQRFCPEASSISGAANSALRAIRRDHDRFFCSDCLQSRNGGPYGSLWIEPR